MRWILVLKLCYRMENTDDNLVDFTVISLILQPDNCSFEKVLISTVI